MLLAACLAACSKTTARYVQGRSRRQAAVGAPALRLLQTIPLRGVEGRFDHFALDARRQRLFVAALGNNTLQVLELRTGQPLRSIPNLPKATGVVFVAPLNRIFAASGEGGRCAILDGATFAQVGSAPGLPDADNVRCDASARQVYVGYGQGALAILDAATGRRVGDIPLAAHPEAFELEAKGPRIFVNVPEAGHIAVIDRSKRAVIATWPTEGASSNFPMALDEAHHRLFVGCREPSQVLVYNTLTGQVVTALEVGEDTDDLFYDASLKRLYVSCGSGEIDAFQASDADHYDALASVSTAPGARTSFFSPGLERLYLAVPHRGRQGAEIRVYATSPTGKPGKLTGHAQRKQ